MSKKIKREPLLRITRNIVEEHFSKMPKTKPKFNGDSIAVYIDNEEDVVSVTASLMIRLLEWAREEAQTDVELHIIAEQLATLSEESGILNMSDYPEIFQVEKNSNKGE